MSYRIYLGINNGEEGFVIPVLPEKIEINESGDNKTFEVVNLGEINSINLPKLTEISFESFFPLNDGPYVSSEQLFVPSFYHSKIKEWREARQKIRFIFIGGPIEINDLFTIENFKLTEKGGEVGDIYYSIELKKYKSYAAKKVIILQSTASNSSAPVLESEPEERPVETPQPQTHTVSEGDTLWAIAKRYLGDGSRYPEIAELNNVENPDVIYPGQVFTIP
jgi:LysM repeat protein